MSRFHAAYHGRCAAGDQIQPGELVEYDGNELVHANCATADRPEPRRPVCPDCWTIHAGAC